MSLPKARTIVAAAAALLAAPVAGQAGVITFINDYEGFVQAAGNVQTIDFEVLPDGSPPTGGVEITPKLVLLPKSWR